MTPDELRRLFPHASMSTIRANTRTGTSVSGLQGDSIKQRDSCDEPVAKDEREAAYQGKRFVRITSHRERLLDERNLWEKHFVDALQEAGILFDDSTKYAEIQVRQVQCDELDECTVIEVWTL